jgi:hypothetical protein
VIVSLVYKVTGKLLSVPAVLLRRDTSKDAELPVLRHENAVLHRQLKRPAALVLRGFFLPPPSRSPPARHSTGPRPGRSHPPRLPRYSGRPWTAWTTWDRCPTTSPCT